MSSLISKKHKIRKSIISSIRHIFLLLVFIITICSLPVKGLCGTGINPSTGELDLTIDIQEEDGSPIVYAPETIKVTNGTLTDNGDGTASLAIGAGGGESTTVSDTTTVNLTLTGSDITADGLYTGGVGVGLTNADFTFDATELDNLTWDAGTLTKITWTWDTDTTDPTMTFENSGMIGIGTTNPTTALDVIGTVNATALTEGGLAVYNSGEIETALQDGGSDELAITAGMMNAGTAADATTFWRGDNTWVAPGGSGDITKIGDVASGDAFDGTQGTTLTFNNAGGDGTLLYDATNAEFSFNKNVGIGTTNPTQALDVVGTINGTTIKQGGTQVAVSGGAYHDGFSDFVANEHIDWTAALAGTIHTDNYIENVSTSLGIGTTSPTTMAITSDGSADDVVLTAANTSNAGLLSSAKFDEIEANTLKETNTDTQDLGIDGNNVTLVDGGTADISTTTAVTANSAKVTNATHTGEVTGATELTIADSVAVTSWNLTTPIITTSIDLPAGAINTATEIAADLITYTQTADADQRDTKCVTIETPADADDFLWFRCDTAYTVTSIDAICEAATSAVVVVNECDSAGDNCGAANTKLEESITVDVDGQADDGTLGNPGVAAGNWLRLQVGTVTGTPGHVTTCVSFLYDD